MKALFAGSFDPFTVGHLDIAMRALNLFGNLVIAIGDNEGKKCMWTVNERIHALKEKFHAYPNIEIYEYKGLTVDFARNINADFIVRGVRNIIDFEFEKNLADVNKKISGIETIILISDPSVAFVSSSMVKELIHNGFDASAYMAAQYPQHK